MAISIKSSTFIQSLSADLSEALIQVRTFEDQPYIRRSGYMRRRRYKNSSLNNKFILV